MKQGGQQIYVGPLGQQSSNLISYFEVENINAIKNKEYRIYALLQIIIFI